MTSRASRAGRAWLVALVATVVAAMSHTLADGRPPSAFGLGASLVLAGSACTLLSGRQQSLWRLTASVAISQVLFHALFSGMGTPGPVEHIHAPELADLSPAHGHAADMWLAHITAGILTLVALRHAESAVWGLARTLRVAAGRMLALWRPLSPAPARALVPRTHAIRPRRTDLLHTPTTYRGPPAGLNAA